MTGCATSPTQQLIEHMASSLTGPKWTAAMDRLAAGTACLHLAILIDPFYSWLMDGTKTIESRFSRVRCAPYGAIAEGDIIAVKKTGGMISGAFPSRTRPQLPAHPAARRPAPGQVRRPDLRDRRRVLAATRRLRLRHPRRRHPRPAATRPRLPQKGPARLGAAHPRISPAGPAVTSISPAAIAIAGPIGAGKTTLAALLSTQLGWPRTAYGDLLRSIAMSRGLPASRSCLQQLGTEVIAGGWDAFTALLLQQATRTAGQGLIVDGLRHREAASALAAAVRPWPTYLIFLDIPPGVGLERAARRDHVTDSTWRQSASHPVETELPAVKAIAHLVIHVTAVSPQRVAQLIMFCLRQPGAGLSGGLCA